MTEKILRIKDAEYFNSATIELTDHPTEDVHIYLESALEPALPKDWKPACYNYSELVEGCAQIPFTDKPECRRCPYREVKL